MTDSSTAPPPGPAGPVPELEGIPTRELLRLYGQILSELIGRGVLRSRNAPAGDLAEVLVARALGGRLAAKSEKSWDVLVGHRRVQVKCRVVDSSERRTQQFSPFRSWAFDSCVFVLLDAHTYDVVRALEIDVADVEASSRRVEWVAASRISVAQVLAHPAVVDVTELLREAYDRLDAPLG